MSHYVKQDIEIEIHPTKARTSFIFFVWDGRLTSFQTQHHAESNGKFGEIKARTYLLLQKSDKAN